MAPGLRALNGPPLGRCDLESVISIATPIVFAHNSHKQNINMEMGEMYLISFLQWHC